MTNDDVSTKKVIDDLKTVVQDAEELIKATAGQLGDKAKESRERLIAALGSAKETYTQFEDRAVAGAKATDRVVRDHPYQFIGVAFGIGLLIGVLVNRK